MFAFTPKRTRHPIPGSHGTSGYPVAMKLIASSAGRWPGPGVPTVEKANGSSSGSFTDGTGLYSAPTTDPAAGVIAISHQCADVRKRGAQNETTAGRPAEMIIGLR